MNGPYGDSLDVTGDELMGTDNDPAPNHGGVGYDRTGWTGKRVPSSNRVVPVVIREVTVERLVQQDPDRRVIRVRQALRRE
jgi:hypothetical protein